MHLGYIEEYIEASAYAASTTRTSEDISFATLCGFDARKADQKSARCQTIVSASLLPADRVYHVAAALLRKYKTKKYFV